MKATRRIFKSEKGAAMLMAISTLTLLIVIAVEIMYESTVEFAANAQTIHQVKAYYAAKSGVEISLLRLRIYQQAMNSVGKSLAPGMLDPIWTIPFSWPPMTPPGMSTADQALMRDVVKESVMQGSYAVSIASEGAKIDINDLESPAKGIAEATRKQLLQLFKSRLDTDQEFAQKYRDVDFGRLLNNITDWIDADKQGRNGADEASFYRDLPDSDNLPPNQSFKTVQELHMVEGMNDEFYDMLKDRVTVYGSKGVNVNYASKEVLMSLTALITSEIADKIVEARNNPRRGPFKDKNDFVSYINSIGVPGDPFTQQGIPLIFDPEFVFRITSTGNSGPVIRSIEALVYDFDRAKFLLKNALDEEAKAAAAARKSLRAAQTLDPRPEPNPDPDAGPVAGAREHGTGTASPASKGSTADCLLV